MNSRGTPQVALMWLARLGLLGITGIVTIMALDPDASNVTGAIEREPDKIVHIFVTAALSLIGVIAFPTIKARSIFISVAGLSVLVELAQLFIGRSAHLTDLVSSWIGVGAIALAFYSPWLRHNRSDGGPE